MSGNVPKAPYRGREIDQLYTSVYMVCMDQEMKKVTVNIPARTLENAMKQTGQGITPTIIEGLEEIERRSRRSALRALRGKIAFDLDLEETRR